MDKKTIRKEIYKYFDALSDKTLRDLSLETSWILVSQKQWSEAGTILLFLTFGKEFQTDFLIKQAFKSNKKVAVPRIYGKDMKFHYINSLNDPFELNKWDIREPLEPTPSWTSADGRALMLTPGLAFSKGGGRLGRGGGFYDRFLSEYGNDLTTVGLCFEQQIREDFPVNEHDYLINAVCSNRSFYN